MEVQFKDGVIYAEDNEKQYVAEREENGEGRTRK